MYQNIPTKVRTGEVRLSYVHLNQPYANQNQPGSAPKYSVTMLIPKSDTRTKQDIDQSIMAAYEAAVKDKWQGARPQLRNKLIYDGDGVRNDGTPFGEECKGHWVITASSPATRKPQVVHQSNVGAELDPQDIYSGMYAQVTINFFSFNTAGNRGVGCGLGNVMKTRDGEPLGGGASAASDFADMNQGNATPNYGGAMPATPGEAGFQNTGVTPQINPITGLPM